LRYLKGMSDYNLVLRGIMENGQVELRACTDSDFAGCIDTRRSTGYKQSEATKIFIDYEAAIKLATNPINHKGAKHFEVK
jgi:hypothetical protein